MDKKKALFLDRDGTINHDKGYTNKIENLKLLDGVIEGLRYALNKGYILIVITNQSGIGRGYFTINDMNKFNRALSGELNKYDILITKIYYCPHNPDEGCSCRKPSPELVFKASKEFNIDLSLSYFVGDRESDVLCAINSGCKPILIKTNSDNTKLETEPEYIIKSLSDLTEIL